MLSWTSAGAVPWPTTLQMRVSISNEAQIKAGAPTPSRTLSLDEIKANFSYFANALETKRSKGSKRLTLSGLESLDIQRIGTICQMAKTNGFEHVLLHISANMLHKLPWIKWKGMIDTVSIGLISTQCISTVERYAANALAADIHVRVSLPLTQELMQNLDAHVKALLKLDIDGLTLIYPFPGLNQTPPPSPIIAGKEAHNATVGLEKASIKGLPICLLPKGASLPRKTTNRWYVDSENQTTEALMFFPGVQQYYKSDACRFCRYDTQCDGFFKERLGQNISLTPL